MEKTKKARQFYVAYVFEGGAGSATFNLVGPLDNKAITKLRGEIIDRSEEEDLVITNIIELEES